jgi:HK97 family phage major capsid protein
MKPEEFDALVARFGEESAKTIKEQTEKIQKDLDQKLETASKNNATKSEVKTLIEDAIEAANDAVKTEVDKIMKAQGEALAELKDQLAATKKVATGKSFTKSLMAAFEEQREVLDKIVKSGKQTEPFVIVVEIVAVTMGEDNTIGSGATAVSLTEDTGIISPIRRRLEKYLQSVSTGSISNARALWIEETDEQGVPIFIGEGDGKIALSSLWVERTANVKKIAVYGKVTTELMADLPQLISYIKNSLMKRLSVKTESELLDGDNIGDNINGAINLATAFSGGGLNGLVVDANEFDVIRAIALQVEVANGIPNAVYIHPVTWAKMQTLKDEQGRPIWKDYVQGNGDVVIHGMKIITSTAVTADNFVGGDMTVLNVLFREQLTIQIGLDGNDFINNKKTILAESRLVQFASANDTPCLVKGVFEDAIEDLEVAAP